MRNVLLMRGLLLAPIQQASARVALQRMERAGPTSKRRLKALHTAEGGRAEGIFITQSPRLHTREFCRVGSSHGHAKGWPLPRGTCLDRGNAVDGRQEQKHLGAYNIRSHCQRCGSTQIADGQLESSLSFLRFMGSSDTASAECKKWIFKGRITLPALDAVLDAPQGTVLALLARCSPSI